MADYPYNFAGILEALAGGINSFVKTRNDMAVFQRERARQEAKDEAERQFQEQSMAIERERAGYEGRRVAEEEAAGKLQRSDYVRDLEDKLRAAGFDEREIKATMAELQANTAASLASGRIREMNLEEQILNLTKAGAGGVGPNGEPLGIPASVRDNLITATLDQLDQMAAQHPAEDVEFQNRIARLKLSLPFAIATGAFGPKEVQDLLDSLLPEGPAPGAPAPQKRGGASKRTPVGKAVGAVGGAVRGAEQILPAPFGGLRPAMRWLFTPAPEESLAGAATEMKTLTQPPVQPYGPELSPELKKRREDQQRRMAISRRTPPR